MGYDYQRYKKYSTSVADFAAEQPPSLADIQKIRRISEMKKEREQAKKEYRFMVKFGLGDAYRHAQAIFVLTCAFTVIAVVALY